MYGICSLRTFLWVGAGPILFPGIGIRFSLSCCNSREPLRLKAPFSLPFLLHSLERLLQFLYLDRLEIGEKRLYTRP
jgi:hypothetical protein